MFKKMLAAVAAALCFANGASAETYGTAQFGQAKQGDSPITLSIWCCAIGTEQLWAFKSWVAQAIELPVQYHDIQLNSITLGIMAGTEPRLEGPGGIYLPDPGPNLLWATFDLGGVPLTSNRFVIKIDSATAVEAQPEVPIDYRLLTANAPSPFEGAHVITETYWPAYYTHTQSQYSLLYSVEFTASTAPVPEVASGALIAVGICALWAVRHRRNPEASQSPLSIS